MSNIYFKTQHVSLKNISQADFGRAIVEVSASFPSNIISGTARVQGFQLLEPQANSLRALGVDLRNINYVGTTLNYEVFVELRSTSNRDNLGYGTQENSFMVEGSFVDALLIAECE